MKLPRKAHCVLGALFSLLCLMFIGSLIAIEHAACGTVFGGSCGVVPPSSIVCLAAGVLIGLLWTAYKTYRDFHLGEYWFTRDE